MEKITIADLVKKFGLEVVAGERGLSRVVESEDLNRPGLEFTGYFADFSPERIQIMGNQEIKYLHSKTEEERDKSIGKVVELNPPCFVVAQGLEDLTYFKKHCELLGVPLLRTNQKTTNFISKLNNYLRKMLAEETSIHGVCLNIFGVGVVLRGKSGVGKSETTHSLIQKWHRLVSDDLVIIRKIDPERLVGTHNGNNYGMLLLRGIGMINVQRIYGAGSVQEDTQIDLDIVLEPWDESHDADILNLDKKYATYLGVTIPSIVIPVRPGRDIASLVEVAVKNFRLMQQGYDALQEFEERVFGSSESE